MGTGTWVIGKCASCGGEARAFASACPKCGIAFMADKPSGTAGALFVLSWIIGIGVFASAKNGISETLGAVIAVSGVAWLAALRVQAPIKGMIVKGLVLALALGTQACVSQGNWDNLPQQDQARFFRCQKAMQPALCGDDHDQVYVTMCVRGAEASYSDVGSAQGRRQWLIEQGCPPPMVNPAPYVASEPPDAPMPRRAASTAPAPVSDDEVAK